MSTCIQKLFEEQVVRTPDEVAVIFKKETLTYKELNEKSNQLARLLREGGVGPDTVVGIMVERSIEMVVGIFGILKAGGAYLPLSPNHPSSRLQFIIEDSGAKLILTQKQILHRFQDSLKADMLALDSISYEGKGENLECINKPSDLVYVIYTSGSTGKPKGVMIEHSALINRIEWMQEAYPISSKDTILQKTPYTFDVSVWEMFWWAIVGAKVCILAPGMEKFPQAIIETTESNDVTIMHFVPSMLSAFLHYLDVTGETNRIKSLKQVFVSGEALLSQHVNRFNKLLNFSNGTLLTNLYGPTEATIDVTAYDCPTHEITEGSVPIGRPIKNIEMFVVDKYGNKLPEGHIGELCISGIGLARGYVNRPQLTAEKFVQYSLDTRIYKTGDLALIRSDGNIEFHGRIDFQVKVNGLRIELGEIESCLMSCEGVLQCAVIVRQESEMVVKLIAFYESENDIELERLKKYLRLFLPDYMIPNSFVRVNEMPLTDSGKIDRKALALLGSDKYSRHTTLVGGSVNEESSKDS
ncbi:amino acid adenylation domain-containing protein [Bacillus cereus]|nr:amino acid adenylation domain-containing protein [Bacillus cereus]MDA2710535.1 amino acid adenylation domain-containing protein [Bacillus cereus]